MLRTLSSACVGFLLVACSSAPSKPAEPVDCSFALQDYRAGRRFELVCEDQRSRVEQYSQVRTDANTKVLTADIMDGLAEHMHKYGFDEFALPGAAPRSTVQGVAWSLEMREGQVTRHVIGYPPGLDADQQARLRGLMVSFLETYNHTYSLQAVDVKPGESPFKSPDPRKGR